MRGITIDGAEIVPVTADFDARRIRQVIDNLISNAIKYGREDGWIVVRVAGDTRNAWVIVQDNGVGISAAEVPSLFDRFFRADAVRHTSTHGSGLGLAISRDIARSHSGDITAESVLGEGSTFVVRLPRRFRDDLVDHDDSGGGGLS